MKNCISGKELRLINEDMDIDSLNVETITQFPLLKLAFMFLKIS